ncbi:hypothetical protein C7E18_21860, partial [Stenotrophomonas maltophilia]
MTARAVTVTLNPAIDQTVRLARLQAGLGVDELSMTPNDIPAVKARLRGTAMTELQALASTALGCETAEQVRGLDGA